MSQKIIAFRVARGDVLHHPTEPDISGVVHKIEKDQDGPLLFFTVRLDSETQMWAFAKDAIVVISDQTSLTETTEAQPLTKLDDLQDADLQTILIDFSEADLD